MIILLGDPVTVIYGWGFWPSQSVWIVPGTLKRSGTEQ